jgi:hypothetical protein
MYSMKMRVMNRTRLAGTWPDAEVKDPRTELKEAYNFFSKPANLERLKELETEEKYSVIEILSSRVSYFETFQTWLIAKGPDEVRSGIYDFYKDYYTKEHMKDHLLSPYNEDSLILPLLYYGNEEMKGRIMGDVREKYEDNTRNWGKLHGARQTRRKD